MLRPLAPTVSFTVLKSKLIVGEPSFSVSVLIYLYVCLFVIAAVLCIGKNVLKKMHELIDENKDVVSPPWNSRLAISAHYMLHATVFIFVAALPTYILSVIIPLAFMLLGKAIKLTMKCIKLVYVITRFAITISFFPIRVYCWCISFLFAKIPSVFPSYYPGRDWIKRHRRGKKKNKSAWAKFVRRALPQVMKVILLNNE
jgi:hypothetical protein